MRCFYNKTQQGKAPDRNLTQDRIERLEEIGFKWNFMKTFEQRCHGLVSFKSEFGHCDVPWKFLVNPSLWTWCNEMRCACNSIQQGQTPKSNLTKYQIECLEEIGFKWPLS
jgi:hypothetical protein